jgi:hypothetical protein
MSFGAGRDELRRAETIRKERARRARTSVRRHPYVWDGEDDDEVRAPAPPPRARGRGPLLLVPVPRAPPVAPARDPNPWGSSQPIDALGMTPRTYFRRREEAERGTHGWSSPQGADAFGMTPSTYARWLEEEERALLSYRAVSPTLSQLFPRDFTDAAYKAAEDPEL